MQIDYSYIAANCKLPCGASIEQLRSEAGLEDDYRAPRLEGRITNARGGHQMSATAPNPKPEKACCESCAKNLPCETGCSNNPAK